MTSDYIQNLSFYTLASKVFFTMQTLLNKRALSETTKTTFQYRWDTFYSVLDKSYRTPSLTVRPSSLSGVSASTGSVSSMGMFHEGLNVSPRFSHKL